MPTSLKSTRILFAALASLGIASLSFAQSVATAPVGAVTTSVNANSDQRAGTPLLRPSLFTAAASGVTAGSISVSGTVPSLGSEVKFVKFTSGALTGQWFTLTGSTASSVSVAENLATLGATAGDKFEVRPFWTLSSLLPSGGGVPVSTDVFDPTGLVLLNDPAAVGINLASSGAYFYHDGSSGFLDAGWYNNDGSLTSADSTVVSPETSLIYRNPTGAVANVVNVGDVPVSPIATTVVSLASGDQDNIIANPYPAAITLSSSGLDSSQGVRASTDVFSPGDLLLVYSTSSSGLNPATSEAYFYHDGSSGFLDAGWYKNDGSLESANSDTIAAGGAFIIRKVSGATTAVDWTPALPYTL